jgi:hypothetical protein
MLQTRIFFEAPLRLQPGKLYSAPPSVAGLDRWGILQLHEVLDDPHDMAAESRPLRGPQFFDLLGQVLPVELLVGAAAGGRTQRLSLLLGPKGEILVV